LGSTNNLDGFIAESDKVNIRQYFAINDLFGTDPFVAVSDGSCVNFKKYSIYFQDFLASLA